MRNDPDNGRESAVAHLRETVGFRVDAPEGYLGRVQGVPHTTRPPSPLVLVVSDRKTVRFVSPTRVAAILPLEQRVILGPARLDASEPARLHGAVTPHARPPRRTMALAAAAGDAEKTS